jgi:20S proteasome alpha/beta subunit
MAIENISKEELIALLKDAIKQASEENPLSDEEIKWVRLAIENEARKSEFRKAIIEKSLGGLAWAALCGIGYLMLEFFRTHWK